MKIFCADINKSRKIFCPYRRYTSTSFLPLFPFSRFYINGCFCPTTFTIYCKSLRNDALHTSLNLQFVIPDKSAHSRGAQCLFFLRHHCCAFCPPLS